MAHNHGAVAVDDAAHGVNHEHCTPYASLTGYPTTSAQALQLESGQNIELREDLTALSAELHRLQTLQQEQQRVQSVEPSPVEPVSQPEASAASPTVDAADGGAAIAEEQAQRLRSVWRCIACCIWPLLYTAAGCLVSPSDFRFARHRRQLVSCCGIAGDGDTSAAVRGS